MLQCAINSVEWSGNMSSGLRLWLGSRLVLGFRSVLGMEKMSCRAILYVMHGTFAHFKDMPQIIMFYYKIEIYVFSIALQA